MSPFPLRTIHLDFHTGPDIPDVGADFDPDAFADTFARAHVDAVTLFAKCHHGHLYYRTDRPERHPGLAPELDLLGLQIEALHKRNIQAFIYISVQCDEYAAATHPEWVALDPDGKQVKWGPHLEAGWTILDMASPYQDFLAEQIEEIMGRYAPVDGVFFDMCWDQISTSRAAVAAMRRRGLDPLNANDRARHARLLAHEYMARYQAIVERHQAGRPGSGAWFNSRPKTNLHEEKRFIGHIEIECLPTGGWGYAHFPYVARFVQPIGLPTLSHTGRFHKSWADFGGLKPKAAMLYECSLILARGLANGIGDQLHPRGRLDQAAYDRIGEVYGHIAACEPYVHGGRVLADIAVIVDPESGDHPRDEGIGIVRALQELRQQFDLLPPGAPLDGYQLAIVPESIRIEGLLKDRLEAHLAGGGGLIVSGRAAVDASGRPALDALGVSAHGESPYTATYWRVAPALAEGVADLDHVMYERGLRLKAAAGAEALCGVVEPYFERSMEHFSSHKQTPAAALSEYAAVVQNGRCITFAQPIFTAYGRHGSVPYRQVLGNAIARLLPRPLVRAGGPVHLETSVVAKDD
ncbi:MAG TPA: alpha-amylase family protein, partial [Limnochordia bacterium]|nr:alpha-amylase family protein [Limnochordia bacterium]